jgi:mRNA-degrading endonuclease RelE of RelBE toxin-antitoxin system
VAAYQVELTARARKQYKALDQVIRDRIRRTLLDLADNPTPAQVKALAGGDRACKSRLAVLPRRASCRRESSH